MSQFGWLLGVCLCWVRLLMISLFLLLVLSASAEGTMKY
jgi:hypothetical protein